jgi:hypothetical protein
LGDALRAALACFALNPLRGFRPSGACRYRKRRNLVTLSRRFWKRAMERFGRKSSENPGAINDCFRPSLGASKADMAEFHAEDMKLRRAHQRKLVRNVPMPIERRNDDEAWRNREFRR